MELKDHDPWRDLEKVASEILSNTGMDIGKLGVIVIQTNYSGMLELSKKFPKAYALLLPYLPKLMVDGQEYKIEVPAGIYWEIERIMGLRDETFYER